MGLTVLNVQFLSNEPRTVKEHNELNGAFVLVGEQVNSKPQMNRVNGCPQPATCYVLSSFGE